MKPITVLLVDDDPVFLQLAQRFLEELDPSHVTLLGTAVSGEIGLAMATRLRPLVVVVDVMLPGMSGLELLPRLRKLLPTAGLVALTLHDASHDRQAALDAGADELVAKIRLAGDLWPAVRRAAALHTTSDLAP